MLLKLMGIVTTRIPPKYITAALYLTNQALRRMEWLQYRRSTIQSIYMDARHNAAIDSSKQYSHYLLNIVEFKKVLLVKTTPLSDVATVSMSFVFDERNELVKLVLRYKFLM